MSDEIRVLIADDQTAVRRGLRTFLELQDGIAVVGETADGEQAVEMADALHPDVVLMDLVMPGLDGVAAARRIRSAHPETKVLVLTSFLDDDRIFPALGARVTGYLVKDVAPEDLVEAIHTVNRGDPYLHPDVGRRLMDQVAPPGGPQGTVTILITDVEGSTRLVSELGDELAREIQRKHDQILRDLLREHGGTEVRHTGDGLMAAFSSARRAVACSVEMQRKMLGQGPGPVPLRVRMGLNTGEPIIEGQNYFGEAVIVAARVAAAADGEQILVSETTKGLAAEAGFPFADRGVRELKGIGPRRLFEVLWHVAGA